MYRTTRAVTDALATLLRARDYADEVGVDPWKFAVEWRLLKASGLEETDIRYLVARGLVELKREISLATALDRTFVPYDVPRISRDAAFILTPEGVNFCRTLSDSGNSTLPASLPLATSIVPSPGETPPPTPLIEKPHWDPDRRELTYGGEIVKRYRVPSPNQELILSVFQEEEWPAFIDDPLPPDEDLDSITRLQATVKSLNRRQVNKLIRFSGNGGKKVLWESVT